MLEETKPQSHPIFVHSKLDDYGLDPYEFRLYAHIARRGYCYARLQTIAEVCKMSVRKAQYALETLCEVGLITKKERPKRQTSIYELAPVTQWKNPSILDSVRKRVKEPKRKRSLLENSQESNQEAEQLDEMTPNLVQQYEKILALSRQKKVDDSTAINVRMTLAHHYGTQERYSEAEALYVQALELVEQQQEEGSTSEVTIAKHLADLYIAQRRTQRRNSEAESRDMQVNENDQVKLGRNILT